MQSKDPIKFKMPAQATRNKAPTIIMKVNTTMDLTITAKIKGPLMYRVEYFRTSTKYPSFTVKQRDSRRDPVTLCTTWNVL